MIDAALAAYALKLRRSFAGRGRTIGASESGRCPRRLYLLKTNSAPRDPGYAETWGSAIRGTVYENHFWYPAMRAAYGKRLKYAGSRQRTFVKDFISATPDGLLTDLTAAELAQLGIVPHNGGDNSLVVECKTIHCYPNSNWPDEPKPDHAYQVQVQLGVIRESTRYRPEFALISYTNASSWDDTREFLVKRDPEVFAAAERRAQQIMTATSARELPPEGMISGGLECGWCPYKGACRKIEAEN
jgi:hypothetical protein